MYIRGSRKDGTWTAQDKMGHRANVNLFFDVISIGGFPRMCHLSVPDPIGNMMGIHWDYHGNILGISWEYKAKDT
jgi:hypothetical protein